jgi:hypothetical protein
MFVPPPKDVVIVELTLSNSVLFTFMPFSSKLEILLYLDPDSLFLIFFIKVASVLQLPIVFIKNFFFNEFEAVFDGFKFSLEQPLTSFDIGDLQNGIWEHLEAVVNLQ